MSSKNQLLLTVISVFFVTIIYVSYPADAVTCVGGGALTITGLPASVNFPTQSPSVTSTTTGIVFGSSLFFEDMRNTSAGFTLNVTATDFTDVNNINNTFAIANLAITSDGNDTIGFVDCDPITGITAGALNFSDFIDSDLNGISDAKTLVTGDVRARIGKYSIEPELQITIPARTPAGNFRTTLTFSIQ